MQTTAAKVIMFMLERLRTAFTANGNVRFTLMFLEKMNR